MIKVSKNEHISNFDPHQIQGLTFDNSRDAVRVHLVEPLTLNVDSIQMPEQKSVPVIIKEVEIHQINVPVIVKEVEKIEIPVIVKEVQVITVDRPIMIPEVRIIEIEKPIIIKEIDIKVVEIKIPVTPMVIKVCIALQTIMIFGMLLLNMRK